MLQAEEPPPNPGQSKLSDPAEAIGAGLELRERTKPTVRCRSGNKSPLAISWPCQAPVAVYPRWGRKVPAPCPICARCGLPMAVDGSYARFVREEGGEVYMVFVRRARCGGCGVGESLLPDFVLARRRDSTADVGLPEGSARLTRRPPRTRYPVIKKTA